VRPHEREERGGVRREAGGGVALELAQDRVLIGGRELGEGRGLRGPGPRVHGGQSGSVGFPRAAQRAAERAVDVAGGAGLDGARAVLVGWKQARGNRVERRRFLHRERLERVAGGRLGELASGVSGTSGGRGPSRGLSQAGRHVHRPEPDGPLDEFAAG